MSRPAHLLFELAGAPPQDGCRDIGDDRCRVCAESTSRAIAYERWQGSGFTDQNKLRYVAGTITCEACVWAHAWNQPPGAPPPAPGKKGTNLRLYSHLYDQRGYLYLNKADKPAIRQWLLAPKSPPWFCAIADSGQKHVLPWTPMNLHPLQGTVRFEDRDVRMGAGRMLLDLCELLTAGATKAEVETGDYRPETWLRAQQRVRAFEQRWRHERGGGWFALAVWLAQRDEDAVAARLATEKEAKADGRRKARPSDGPRGGRAPRGEAGVSRRRGKRAQALDAAPRPGAAGDEDERPRERVGDDAREGDAPRGAKQLTIFGD